MSLEGGVWGIFFTLDIAQHVYHLNFFFLSVVCKHIGKNFIAPKWHITHKFSHFFSEKRFKETMKHFRVYVNCCGDARIIFLKLPALVWMISLFTHSSDKIFSIGKIYHTEKFSLLIFQLIGLKVSEISMTKLPNWWFSSSFGANSMCGI